MTSRHRSPPFQPPPVSGSHHLRERGSCDQHFPGALSLPLRDLQEKVKTIPRDADAFPRERRKQVVCIAYVTNTMGTSGRDFEKPHQRGRVTGWQFSSRSQNVSGKGFMGTVHAA